jgi:cathepsin C
MRGVAVLLGAAIADLPVHCLRHQVAGSWFFYVSEPSKVRTKCGHQSPDSALFQPAIDISNYPTTTKMHLEDPSIVKSDAEVGTWTMVYDEGFEVRLGSRKYLAFNMFDPGEKVDGPMEKFKSDCTSTQVGWYKDEVAGTWGCFVASQKDLKIAPPPMKLLPEPAIIGVVDRHQPFDGDGAMSRLNALTAAFSNIGSGVFLQVDDSIVPLETHHKHVEAINSQQTSWKAQVYPRLLNKTHAELNRFAGIRRSGQKPARAPKSFLQFATHEKRIQDRVSGFPTDFDWRNKDGQNFVTAPMDQGECGSCYAVSSVSMITARRRIMENNPTAEAFSTEFPLACSEYNQGCDGGYPELIAKWSQDVGLVPESCARYSEGRSCKMSCNLTEVDRYKVGDYGYVGGFYGATDEASMMEEIHSRGPVAVAIEPSDDFMYYKSGIYAHAATLFKEWAKVDHAVMVTGWGEENGKKYWRVQNSWGPDWGEAGTFRIRRGVDESAIEAQAIYATVERTHDTATFGLYL